MLRYSRGIFFTVILVLLGSTFIHAMEDMRTRFFQKNGFVLCEQFSLQYEKDFPGNDANVQSDTRTTVKDGLIYDAHNNLLDTTKDGLFVYAMNHDGTLYTASNGGKHHSYFLKSKPEKLFYGIGRNVACAGTLQAKDGKITSISNESGHYLPIKDQLVLAVQFLAIKGVVDENLKISLLDPYYEGYGGQSLSLNDIMRENPETILSKYPNAMKRTPEYQAYIDARRISDQSLNAKVKELYTYCPTSFLTHPVTDLIKDFHLPPLSSRMDLGQLTIDNKHWDAFLENQWNNINDLPDHVLSAPPSNFKWNTNFFNTTVFQTIHENGVVKRRPACVYNIMHMPNPQKSFSLYLIPKEIEETLSSNVSP